MRALLRAVATCSPSSRRPLHCSMPQRRALALAVHTDPSVPFAADGALERLSATAVALWAGRLLALLLARWGAVEALPPAVRAAAALLDLAGKLC